MATDTTNKATPEAPKPAAWRVSGWLKQVPIGRTKFYTEKKEGRIVTVKCGDATLILTPPDEYVANLRATSA